MYTGPESCILTYPRFARVVDLSSKVIQFTLHLTLFLLSPEAK